LILIDAACIDRYDECILLVFFMHHQVNGWEAHYVEKSFLYQCKDRFGAMQGEQVWEECNQAFDRLPIAAVIDHEIFCIHGGIPRPVVEDKGFQSYQNNHNATELETIMSLPSVIAIMPAYEHEEDWMKQVATDCIWSDPASEDMENYLDRTGEVSLLVILWSIITCSLL